MESLTLFDESAVASDALISECGQYRYWLARVWSDKPLAMFVMLNPSTADAHVDDPTIRRCMGFARAWGFGGIGVVNLYALYLPGSTELTPWPPVQGHSERTDDVATKGGGHKP